MGNNTSSTIDVSKEIYNTTLTNLQNNGNITQTDLVNNINNTTITLNGQACPDTKTKINIGNFNNLTSDAILTAAAESYADTMATMASKLSNTIAANIVPGSDINAYTSDRQKVASAMKSYLESTCNTSRIHQQNNLNNVMVDVTCAELDISNSNVQTMSCALDSMSKSTNKLTADLSTEASNSSSNTTIIIIVVIAVLLLVVMMISANSGVIIIIIIIAAVAIIFVVFYFKEEKFTQMKAPKSFWSTQNGITINI